MKKFHYLFTISYCSYLSITVRVNNQFSNRLRLRLDWAKESTVLIDNFLLEFMKANYIFILYQKMFFIISAIFNFTFNLYLYWSSDYWLIYLEFLLKFQLFNFLYSCFECNEYVYVLVFNQREREKKEI